MLKSSSPTVFVALLAFTACTRERPAPPVEALTIAVPANLLAASVLLAHAKGYFAEEGVEVTLQYHPFGKLALESALAGKADLAICADTPIVFAELRGEHVSVLASVASSSRNVAVVARRAAGIARPTDLVGRRIGVTAGTSGDFFLDTFLLRHGVARGAIHFVELSPGEMGDALDRGEVDAVATWNPTVLLLRRRFGNSVAVFREEELYAETSLLVGRRGFGKEHPAAARRVLRALLRAEATFRDHPGEASRMVAAELADDSGLLDEMLMGYAVRVRLDQSLLVLLEEEARWALRGQPAGRAAPDFLEALDPGPLMTASPEAVGLAGGEGRP